MTITKHTVTASMTLPEFWTPVSMTPIYADGFQEGITAWQGWSADDVLAHTFNPATSRYEMRHTWTKSAGPDHGRAYDLNVPVTAGKTYQLVVHARGDVSSLVSCLLIGGTPVVPTGASVQASPYGVECTYLLTATGSTVNVNLRVDNDADAAVVFWQDVALFEMVATTELDLPVVSGQATLDESWTPFVRASITCPIPAAGPLALIDPRVDPITPAPPQRVRLYLAETDVDSQTLDDLSAQFAGQDLDDLTALFAGQTLDDLTALWGAPYNATVTPDLTHRRSLDLMLRTREVDWLAGTMTLELTSDEMLLQDLKRYDADTIDQRPPTTFSLRTMVQWGLAQIGATLHPFGAADAVIDGATVIWNLGESLWSFLDAFIRTNGLRLYCDEQRRWFLEAPATGASGTLELTAITQMRDVLSREDPAYGDGAVVIYEWFDDDGVRQRVYQFAAVPDVVSKVVVQTFTVPNPSLAAAPAAALRTRALTRGRDVGIEAVSDYRADPGQSVLVTSPVTTVNGAMVSAVTWRFPEDRMDISTRDSVD